MATKIFIVAFDRDNNEKNNEGTLWYGSGKSILFISLNFLVSYSIKNLVLFNIVDVFDTG